MRIAAAALLAAMALSHPALARGPVVVMPDVEPAAPAPASVLDWSGLYVGLGYGTATGTVFFTPSFDYDLESGQVGTLFAGYLMQRGSFVYGGELAYSRGMDILLTDYPGERVANVLDLKAKAGFSANRALFYGVIGYSRLDYEAYNTGFSTSGIAYGLGADFAITDRLSIGLEYLARQTSGDTYNPGQTADIDLNTATLRLAYRF